MNSITFLFQQNLQTQQQKKICIKHSQKYCFKPFGSEYISNVYLTSIFICSLTKVNLKYFGWRYLILCWASIIFSQQKRFKSRSVFFLFLLSQKKKRIGRKRSGLKRRSSLKKKNKEKLTTGNTKKRNSRKSHRLKQN